MANLKVAQFNANQWQNVAKFSFEFNDTKKCATARRKIAEKVKN